MSTAFDIVNKSSTMALSGGNLVATSSGVGTAPVSRRVTGLTYCEFTITTLAGTPGVGFVNSAYNMASGTVMGTGNDSISYRSSGVVARNNTTITTLATYAQGDRVDMAIDAMNKLAWFRVNGGNWNNDVIANQNPVGAVGGIDYSALSALNVMPAVTASITGTVITGAFDTFAGTAPSGYSSITSVQSNPTEVRHKRTGFSLAPPTLSVGCFGHGSAYPVPGTKSVSGTVKEAGSAVSGKKVLLYDAYSGTLIGRATSGAAGAFSIPAMGRTNVFAVALDPPYQAIIFDQVVPL